jgi:hypothetical protein
LSPHTVRPIIHAEHGTVKLGVLIHSGAFTRTPNA